MESVGTRAEETVQARTVGITALLSSASLSLDARAHVRSP